MPTQEQRANAPQVRPYDFRHPERLTQSARERLGEHQRGLAAAFSTKLSRELRAKTGVEFQNLDEMSSDRFLDCGYDPVLALEPSESCGTVLLRLEAGMAQAFVDRLLGGVGQPRKVEREPTGIEISLLEHLSNLIQGCLAVEWGGADRQGGPPTCLPAEGRKKASGRGGVGLTFGLALGETQGQMQLFYGHEDLATVLGLEARAVGGRRADPETARRVGREDLAGVALPVRVQFPATPVQIRDITSLRVGDVLHLGLKPDQEIEIQIGGRLAFYGYPGRSEGAYGVQVSRRK